MRGWHQDNADNIKRETKMFLKSLTLQDFDGNFKQLNGGQKKCIMTSGRYFEAIQFICYDFFEIKKYCNSSFIYWTHYVYQTIQTASTKKKKQLNC